MKKLIALGILGSMAWGPGTEYMTNLAKNGLEQGLAAAPQVMAVSWEVVEPVIAAISQTVKGALERQNQDRAQARKENYCQEGCICDDNGKCVSHISLYFFQGEQYNQQ